MMHESLEQKRTGDIPTLKPIKKKTKKEKWK